MSYPEPDENYCQACEGYGDVQCRSCKGKGYIETHCQTCGHVDERDCEECDGAGEVACPQCKGRVGEPCTDA